MKTRLVYSFFLILFAAFVFFLIKRQNPKTELMLIERTSTISNSTEWINTKASIQKLLSDLRSNPQDIKAKLQLAFAYIQESRVSGNHDYYDKVALQLIDEILDSRPNDYEALCAKATLLLSQHHFTDALEIGKRVTNENPYSAFGYGILTDAYVELGNYNKAIECADKMVSLRPDIRSYSRVSYLREIFGDYEGSIQAMNMAVQSGIPGTEQTEWSRVYLGKLYELTGQYQEAEYQYRSSLVHRPQYSFALAGIGRIEKVKSNFSEAEKYMKAALNNNKDFSLYDELADLHIKMNKSAEANAELKNAIKLLSAGSGDESNSSHGHYSDRELALLYLKTYRYDLALQHALAEYNRRPENIDVNQTLAWVRFRRGDYMEAARLIDVALKTNSVNPVLLFQAGLIKAGAGNISEGKKLMKQSLAINKHISDNLKWEAKGILKMDELYALK